MTIGVLRELQEKRVSIVPDTLKKSKLEGINYLFEKDLGIGAFYGNNQYEEYGDILTRSDVLELWS